MMFVPSGKVVVPAEAATPLAAALVLKATPLVRKITLPVGVPAPGATAVRVAVKITFDPGAEGFKDETKASALLAGVMLAVVVGWVRV
jgi:hypothetical protein